MERGVNVNVNSNDGLADRPTDYRSDSLADSLADSPPDTWADALTTGWVIPEESGVPVAVEPSTPGDLGPCLYFGPAGERCNRRATSGSFCRRHQPALPGMAPSREIPRRALAGAGIIAVLWPLLADLVREIIRFLR